MNKPRQYQLDGAHWLAERRGALLGDDMGLGKQQPIDAKVLSKIGWVPIGSLQIGDRIYGADGCPTTVTGVYPQGVKDIYRVAFRDGTSTECGLEHLWRVRDGNRRSRGTGWTTKTTTELLDHGLKGKNGARKWDIPVAAAVGHMGKAVYIPPYILGVLLGDGALSTGGALFSCPDFDNEIVDNVRSRLTPGYHLTKRTEPSCPQYRITTDNSRGNRYVRELRQYGLLVHSPQKFIPDMYKICSIPQRLELLQGLMDTDGSCTDNRATFHTTSVQLAHDVAELVRSLGGVAIERWYDRTNDNKPFECQLNVKMDICPFLLRRKAAQWAPPKRGNRVCKFIDSIEFSRQSLAVCISVSAKDGLYITDDYILTHNTAQAVVASQFTRAKRVIVICPAIGVINWRREFHKWLDNPPELEIHSYRAVSTKAKLRKQLREWQADVLICDEAHYLKTPGTKRTNAIYGQGCNGKGLTAHVGRTWLITGTPALRDALDLWPHLNVLWPELLCQDNGHKLTRDGFMQRYCTWRQTEYTQKVTGLRRDKLPELRMILDLVMLRRKVSDVAEDMPDVVWHDPYIITVPSLGELPEMEATAEVQELKRVAEAAKHDETTSLYTSAEPIVMASVRRLTAQLKAPKIADLIACELEADEYNKIVLFALHTDAIDIARDKLAQYKPAIVRGGQTAEARQAEIDRFTDDPASRVAIVQEQAGNHLINLEAANQVAFIEQSWVHGENVQAAMRCRRLTQTETVFVRTFGLRGSVDETVTESLTQRARMYHQLME